MFCYSGLPQSWLATIPKLILSTKLMSLVNCSCASIFSLLKNKYQIIYKYTTQWMPLWSYTMTTHDHTQSTAHFILGSGFSIGETFSERKITTNIQWLAPRRDTWWDKLSDLHWNLKLAWDFVFCYCLNICNICLLAFCDSTTCKTSEVSANLHVIKKSNRSPDFMLNWWLTFENVNYR